MGNQASSEAYGGIYTKLDYETATPEDVLTGAIYLNVINPYPGDKLCLFIKGHEHTRWIDKESRTRRRADGTTETYYVDVVRESTIHVIDQEITVYHWQKGAIIPKGQYIFPFQFGVPPGLPGSFHFRRGNVIADIKYTVESFLKPEKSNIPKLSHKIPVTMRENPKTIIQTKEVSITKKLKTWCCLDQGTCTMRSAFEKNAYVPTEEARVITEVDNSKCALGIPNVKFSLVQTIHLTASGHHKRFSYVIRSTSLGRIEAGQTALGDQRKEASIILPPGQEEGYVGDPTSAITPSTHGSLIESDFNLQVVCETEGCLCCDAAPTNSLPILVYAPVVMRQADPTPPPNWQPQQMPAANLIVNAVNTPDAGMGVSQDGMVSNQMPPQNASQPDQAPQMNQMSSPQPQPQPIQTQKVQIGKNSNH